MNLQIITLLMFIGIVVTYKPRKQIPQRPITIPRKSTKKLDIVPARYKMPRKIQHEPVVKNLPFFPEVEYPTNIMEVSKPFYYSSGSDSLSNEPKVVKPYLPTNAAPRRDSRKAGSQDHSNLLKLIESIKKNATKNAITKSSLTQDNLSVQPLILETDVTNTTEITDIPVTIESILESEMTKEKELNTSPETEEGDVESEIEVIDYYFPNDCGSGYGELEMFNENYFYNDYSNDTDLSIEENEYPHIFRIDLLAGLANYTDFDIIEGPLITSDEVCLGDILGDIEIFNNETEEFGINNSTNFIDNETNYIISQSSVPTNNDKMTGSFNRPTLIAETAETIALEDNHSKIHSSNVRVVKKIPLLKTRNGLKLQRKRLLGNA